MKIEALKSLVEILKEMRDTASPSVRKEIDQAIADLEYLIEEDSFTPSKWKFEALRILERLLSNFPSVLRLIELFSNSLGS